MKINMSDELVFKMVMNNSLSRQCRCSWSNLFYEFCVIDPVVNRSLVKPFEKQCLFHLLKVDIMGLKVCTNLLKIRSEIKIYEFCFLLTSSTLIYPFCA